MPSKRQSRLAKVSCIIPAYNEEKRIAAVLRIVTKHPLIGEVIVVDDGSRDETARVAGRFPSVKVIKLKKNSGKAYAVRIGAQAARFPIVALIDADLINLKEKNITDLIRPVIIGKVDVTLSIRNQFFGVDQFNRFFYLDALTGERCIPRDILLHIPLRRSHRYALEVLINEYILRHKLRFMTVNFRTVGCVSKMSKEQSNLRGIKKGADMFLQIFEVMPPHKFLAQFAKMAKENEQRPPIERKMKRMRAKLRKRFSRIINK